MPRVAFLGLGAIGAPMARHLARPEFDLAVWNRTSPKAEALASELGVRHALTPADAARAQAAACGSRKPVAASRGSAGTKT